MVVVCKNFIRFLKFMKISAPDSIGLVRSHHCAVSGGRVVLTGREASFCSFGGAAGSLSPQRPSRGERGERGQGEKRKRRRKKKKRKRKKS